MTGAAERQSTRVGCGVGTNCSRILRGTAALGRARRGNVSQSKDGAGARLTQVHHYFEGARA